MLYNGIKLAAPPKKTADLCMASLLVALVGSGSQGQKQGLSLGPEAAPAFKGKASGTAAARRRVAPLLLLRSTAGRCTLVPCCLRRITRCCCIPKGDVDEQVLYVDRPEGPDIEERCLAVWLVVAVVAVAGLSALRHVMELWDKNFAPLLGSRLCTEVAYLICKCVVECISGRPNHAAEAMYSVGQDVGTTAVSPVARLTAAEAGRGCHAEAPTQCCSDIRIVILNLVCRRRC